MKKKLSLCLLVSLGLICMLACHGLLGAPREFSAQLRYVHIVDEENSPELCLTYDLELPRGCRLFAAKPMPSDCPMPETSRLSGTGVSAELTRSDISGRDPSYQLRIEAETFPSSGSLELRELLPFILAKGVETGRTHTLAYSGENRIIEGGSEYIIEPLDDLRLLFTLPASADASVAAFEFVDTRGGREENKPYRSRLSHVNEQGQQVWELSFSLCRPNGFRVLRLIGAQAVTLSLNDCLSFPDLPQLKASLSRIGAQEGLKARFVSLTQSFKGGSPTQLSLSWELETPQGCFLPAYKQSFDRISKFVNGDEDKLYFNLCNESERMASLTHDWRRLPSTQVIRFNETLPLYMAGGKRMSECLPLDASQPQSYELAGQVYTASPRKEYSLSYGMRQGFDLSVDDDLAWSEYEFQDAAGAELIFSVSTRNEAKRHSFFYSFREALPHSFRVEYFAPIQHKNIPCAFQFKLPQVR